MVAEYFGHAKQGFFVEVGANEPRVRSQTWHLEQAGWRGILVEPQPDLAAQLRAERSAAVYEAACTSRRDDGNRLTFFCAGPLSSLDRDGMAPGAVPEKTISVACRTLDSILEESRAPEGFDFLSIDVEGHELAVLDGLDLARWRPRLVMLEDHVADLAKHRAMRRAGYRLIRRYENNGWYVPAAVEATLTPSDAIEIIRKYYLALPFRSLRNAGRRMRQSLRARTATS